MNQGFARLKFPAALFGVLLLLFHISAVVEGVRGALTVCAVSIIPSLFVFMIAADLTVTLTAGDTCGLPPKYAVFLLGALCGFPIGAVVCERMTASGALSKEDAARLLPFTNNASPAFVIGAVGGMLGDRRLGVLICVSQIFASLLFSLPIRVKHRAFAPSAVQVPIGDAFFSAVDAAVRSILRISALICLFSALLAVLRTYLHAPLFYAVLAALLEIGSGTSFCASLFPSAPFAAVALCAFACGWSGICVHLQILSTLKSVKVNRLRLLLCKAAQGLLTTFFAMIGCKFLFGY